VDARSGTVRLRRDSMAIDAEMAAVSSRTTIQLREDPGTNGHRESRG